MDPENPPPSDVTVLLKAWCRGNAEALDQLAPVVEAELRRLARTYLSRESTGHTLQPTALINEAYKRLIEWNSVDWKDRTHFFAVAAKMMRRILVNQAAAKNRQKRGAGAVLVSIEEADGVPNRTADLTALDEALAELAKFDERKSQIVELRFFAGLTAEETAEVMNVSLRTIHREWNLARAWLFRQLR
jgi:RNA polymerase sigma factor (TIGR02999 family)